MVPTKLIIDNFRSYKHVEVIFSTDDAILVLGENRDEMGANSNGAAKTSLFDAMSFVLFGKVPKGGFVDEIIRTGTKQAAVEGYFKNGADELKIIRKRGTTNSLAFWVNGSDDHPKSTPTVTQNSLLEYMGITSENKDYFTDFINTTYFSVDSLKAFASKETSSEEKMRIITRLLNLEQLEIAAKLVKLKRQAIDKRLQIKNNRLGELERTLAQLNTPEQSEANKIIAEKDIEKALATIETTTKQIEKAESLEPLKDSMRAINIELQKHGKNYVDKIEQLKELYCAKEKRLYALLESQKRKKEIEKEIITLPKLNEIEDNMELLDDELTDIGAKSNNLGMVLNELRFNIKQDTTFLKKALGCPKCSADLMLDTDGLHYFDKPVIEKRLQESRLNLVKKEKEWDANEADKKKHIAQLNKYKEVKSELSLLFKELKLIEIDPEETASIEADLNKLKERRELFIKEMDEGKKELLKKHTEIEKQIGGIDTTTNIADLKNHIKEKRESIDFAVRTIGRIEEQGKQRAQIALTQKRLQRNIASSARIIKDFLSIEECYLTIRRWKIENFLPEFENISNKYLRHIKCGYQVSLDTMQEKKSAKKDESKYKLGFVINVIAANGYTRSLGSFSKGEGTRIAICLGMALNEIATARSNMPFMFTLLDDVAGEIDEAGADELSILLHSIKGLKMVITQNNNIAKNFSNVITVIKENDISTVSQEM